MSRPIDKKRDILKREKTLPPPAPKPTGEKMYTESEVERLVSLAWEDGWSSVTFTRYDGAKSKSGPVDFWKKHKKK